MNVMQTLAVEAPSRHDDAALAARVAAGDVAAFELLMRRYNRRLYRLARAMLRDGAEAEDALQDAYLAAFRSLGSFRAEASLGTWMSRLVTNQCLARLRRQARRDNIVPMVALPTSAEEGDAMCTTCERPETPDRALDRAQLRAVLERKLDELPEAFRTVFVLRCVEELSVEETAQCLGIPEATVRSRQFRARGLLREALASDIDLAERDVFSFGGDHCDRMVAAVLAKLRAQKGEIS